MRFRKTLSILFTSTLLASSIVGCGVHQEPEVDTSIDYLSLLVTPTSDFVEGKTFRECADILVTAHYKDGFEMTVDNDLSFFLSHNGHSYNFYDHQLLTGKYSLRAKFNFENVYSNIYSFTVSERHYYVNTLTATGHHYVGKEKHTTVTLEVTPSDFNGEINYQVTQGANNIVVTKIDKFNYDVVGYNATNAQIVFSAANSPSSTLSTTYNLVVQNVNTIHTNYIYHDLNNHYAKKWIFTPSIGKVKMLVIPVWFANSGDYVSESCKSTILQDICDCYSGNGSGTSFTSVSKYYTQESHGRLQLSFKVSEWWNCGKTTHDYANEDEFVHAAVNWYFKNHSDSRKDYDFDKDGLIDGICIVYALPDSQALGTYPENFFMWAWTTVNSNYRTEANFNSPCLGGYTWASYDFMYHPGNSASHTGADYQNGVNYGNSSVDPRTYIHEVGHLFGLMDYYSKNTEHAGEFSMQDGAIGGHEPFSCMALGWAEPYVPTQSCTITINDFQSSGDFILLTPQWNEFDSPFDEYMILELFTPTGLNKIDCQKFNNSHMGGTSIPGIRLWHVDAKLLDFTNLQFTTDAHASSKMYPAFDNASFTANNCAAVELNDPSYKPYSFLHFIRSSTSKDYLCSNPLSNNVFNAHHSDSI